MLVGLDSKFWFFSVCVESRVGVEKFDSYLFIYIIYFLLLFEENWVKEKVG